MTCPLRGDFKIQSLISALKRFAKALADSTAAPASPTMALAAAFWASKLSVAV
jgi:hypothetical protein